MSQSSVEAAAELVGDEMRNQRPGHDTVEHDPAIESGDGHKTERPPTHEGD